MGKILYRRLKRNSLITRGFNIAKRMSSSCSMFGWGTSLLKRSSDTNDEIKSKKDNCRKSRLKEKGRKLPLFSRVRKAPDDLLVSEISTGTKATPVSRHLNSNVNARPVTSRSTEEDLTKNPLSGGNKVTKSTFHRAKKSKQKVRKVVRYRGLVARSMGGPKLRERVRAKSDVKSKLLCRLNKRKKRKLYFRSSARLSSQMAKADTSNADFKQDQCPGGILQHSNRKVKDSAKNPLVIASGSATLQNLESPVAEENLRAGTGGSHAAKRKAKKWVALMVVGNTGTECGASARSVKKKRGDKKVPDQKHDHREDLSLETSEWPSLPRTKGHTKEAATEIVKSKHSASVTKMTRKRWADIVSASKYDQAKENKVLEAKTSVEWNTWASVAAKDTQPPEKSENRPNHSKEKTTSVPASGSDNVKKRKKRAEYGLAYTDKIWLTCQKPKGPSTIQNLYRKHFVDAKDKVTKRKSNPGSPRKRSFDKRREEVAFEKQTNTPSSTNPILQTSSDETSSTQTQDEEGIEPKCTSSNQDCNGLNKCLVDYMPVVYTKKAGKVITLNESNHDRPTHRNVNKCNNRAGGKLSRRSKEVASENSVRLSHVSGTDLCSQLSSMTFQTPTNSCVSFSRDRSVSSRTRENQDCSGTSMRPQPSGQPKSSQGLQTDGVANRQKKVSLGYRALLRDSSGPLDARAVSDIHTRNRRADTLQDDKKATRAMRRRLRSDRQITTHNMRRTSRHAATSMPRQLPRPGPSTVTDPGTLKKPAQTKECRKVARSITHLSSAATAKVDNLHQPCSSLSIRQVESTASSSSTDGEVVWPPINKNGTNNSVLTDIEIEQSANMIPFTLRERVCKG
ncbi:hypothetical protein PoB_006298100 [Plakobranchus ocellatus]|uniref:Uncharacterized protein n=1 Tax=Plakobranchus ocellatus TaxID=259542 RepID=A0AAV4CX57_9GAST|nr:hypothetical protein PoB_006298100 [Plakobranchus ocellatus]